jgi:predicted acylesterase/phospholipase RssA
VSGKGADGKCRILALRGGGVHGAFEVGALTALVNNLDPIEVQYDIISGVSVGAIITSAFATYDFGMEKEAVKWLDQQFRRNDALFEFWPSVFFEPLWKNSIIDPSNLIKMLDDILSNNSWKRKVSIQSVDVNTGQIVIFDETTPQDLRTKAVLSSASIPSFFPPVEIEDFLLVDGGTF